MNPIRFDGRVALVTGAGGGMGRSYALDLARRGARVIVNDYGGSMFGDVGGDPVRAQAVVDEIAEAGGTAIASAVAVGTQEAAEGLVDLALTTWDRLDILVNNAGIALPGAIDRLDFGAVENLYRTNLIGPHALAGAAWPVMRRQGYGRILNVSSNAALGIGANSPYAATKAGMIGLTLDLALEGKAHGILVNAVMPVAYSRMIDQVPDPQFVAWMKANFPSDKVAAAMLFMLSEASELSGMVFSAGGGRLARIGFVENDGIQDPRLDPEAVARSIGSITDLASAVLVEGQAGEMDLFTRLHAFDEKRGPGLGSDALG